MCDDIRREDNGKLLLIGVYGQSIAVPQFPATLPSLVFFQGLESDRPGSWTVRMRLQHLDTGQKVMEGMGMINFRQPGAGANPIRLPGVQFQNPGTYHFVLDIEGQPDPIMYEFSVVLRIQQGPAVPGQMMR